jgi:predicted amidophosphoribosyltransferase
MLRERWLKTVFCGAKVAVTAFSNGEEDNTIDRSIDKAIRARASHQQEGLEGNKKNRNDRNSFRWKTRSEREAK